MARLSNPFAFTRWPVTVITSAVYLVIIVALLIVHTTVPSPPASPTPIRGLNLTEAWLDLQLLTASYRPYNSRRNDQVHEWLLERINSIAKENDASPYIFEDNTSNLTFSSGGVVSGPGVSVYFEGTNLIVYIPGKEDDETKWWLDSDGKPSSRNAVLVNAHYDSVSTGFGSTDDGVGVVCVLQLLRYFTTPKSKPKNGVVLLLNNGEEDFLNGANVFSQHPMSMIVSSFLNLEGAGAGGRAALFRSTDDAVTKAYAHSKYPFGSSTSADGFNRGLVRSQTDYVVFNGKLGYRGLDVAFIGPRARYHTDQDDSRHTGKGSLWHMLSAAVATTEALTSASLTTNLDPLNNPGSPSLWFDVFGRTFAVLKAHTFFALSVTLLVVGPVILLLTVALLYRVDKFYLFSGSRPLHHANGDEKIKLYGWRGFFRFPLILLVACAVPIALAYLIFKENQYIAHSSEWAVWAMMISSFVFVAWFFCRAADYTRPSSLTRVYGFSWMWGAWWVLLVVATVSEEHLHLVGLYFVLVYAALVWLATWLAYLELFSLPRKSVYCQGFIGEDDPSHQNAALGAQHEEVEDHADSNDDEPTERSSLLRRGYRQEREEPDPDRKGSEDKADAVEEPNWSKSQWSWLWLLQMLVLIPINVVVVGQIGLLLTEGLHQTGQDGSSMFLLYIMVAACTILLFSPLVPILHRFTWQIPVFLLLVCIGTMVYNLTAFPFSMDNRLKLFFQQQVDLEGGNNTVFLTGASPYTRHAVDFIPSSAGQDIICTPASPSVSGNMQTCSWAGIPPTVAHSSSISVPPRKQYDSWLTFNLTRLNYSDSEYKARFVLFGKNTRACKLVFETANITSFHVAGQAPRDTRFPPVPDGGSQEIRLWSRTWARAWTVDVNWDIPAASSKRSSDPEDPNAHTISIANSTLSGRVVCLWSDVNMNGVIPAFDEVMHYVPAWAAISKRADGLVEGYKRFQI
ncbi:uncharacterized protein Z520_09218 [Fonsecaea multimorphosa CBS 102226]|uniref:Peptide hydrolase n=1 Tax=Fonsecaea multimorphosa CBS 102226 TaxID=1442371 RepID=A0A0D2KE07_9EURO|nr:uncharacterized protein Z520_09218 [Fonsecaea multimorphosa CBS 102226]KIX94908.1 hypothetical protein Z520_09218 [Fonsecaea multimorphosa CBS 102226]OAL20560.1 hypothetical protein AYO22_08569 [Fonsecaea multimorphosa]